MILSFHPCVVTDENRICAGREPDHQDLTAIRRASAVILPQGCPEALYRMAHENCAHLFPHHGPRFDYPGKIGQTQLFREQRTRIPATQCFTDLKTYTQSYPDPNQPPLDFPLVLKLNWGGEGETVFPVSDAKTLEAGFRSIARYEKTGQSGFLLQSRIHVQPTGGALRVVVIGKWFTSYWRISGQKDKFYSSLSHGALIDHAMLPELQRKGIQSTQKFCGQTGINLGGFDLIFPMEESNPEPFFLEINYFFGRRGLGGSSRFYQYLNQEVASWLAENQLI